MTRENKIKLARRILTAGFALAIFYHGFMWLGLGYHHPYNTFLFDGRDRFMDFLNNYWGWHWLPAFRLTDYPVPYSTLNIITIGNFIVYLYSLVQPALTSFLLYIAVFTAVALWFFWFYLRVPAKDETQLNVLVFFLFSYPILFSIDRGNPELYTLLFLLGFAYYYQQERFDLSAVMLGLATGVKPFTLVFFALFIANRQYREAALAFNVYALVSIACAAILSIIHGVEFLYTFNFFEFLFSSTKGYNQTYAVYDAGMIYAHSLFGLIKVILYHFHDWLYPDTPVSTIASAMMRPYFFFACVVFGAVVFYLRRYVLPLWKSVALLTCCMNLLPFVSGDYKLLHIYVPFFLFISAKESTAKDLLYTVIFSLLIVPKTWYFRIFSGIPYDDFSLAVVINPLLMIWLCVLIFKEGAPLRGPGPRPVSV